MARSQAVVWTCLLGVGLALAFPPAPSVTTSEAFPRPPRLTHCVFMYRNNFTCFWEPGDTPATNYTLKIERFSAECPGDTTARVNSTLKTLNCTTSKTSCLVRFSGLTPRINFRITVTAHSGSRDISSHPRCQPGRIEMILPPVSLKSVEPVRGSPRCLHINWSRSQGDFQVTDGEIKAGSLNSQIEFRAQGQLDVQVKNVPVEGESIPVCFFKPDTSYVIRLRHRYLGPASPWSPWSSALQGRTGEDAPSAAPNFWRRVKQTDGNGRRLVSLLWKPLPVSLANGRVLFYNVTCQTDSAQVLSDHGSCRDLHSTSTSCTLPLPAGRCSCKLTASTSAGASPEARLWLLGASETEPPPPSQVNAIALNDSSLEVRWTAPADRSASGFVVEWFAVRKENSSPLHWEKLDGSSTALVITEEVKPMERYAVSVQALYEREAGKNKTLHIYTRQGTPSAGPNVTVNHISGSTAELSWSPVPVELLRGFIRNYTLHYTSKNQPDRSVSVHADFHRYTLENLSPGHYNIYMQANTDAGAGAHGTTVNMYIGPQEISIVMYVVVPLALTSLVLVLMACVPQNKMLKRKLWRDVPDPSNSSLSHWPPKTTQENINQLVVPEKPEIKYSEVISPGELQDSDPDPYHTYPSIHDRPTCSSHQSSPLPDRISEKRLIRSSTKAKTTSVTDLSTCPSIHVVPYEPLQNLSTPLLQPFRSQSNDWQCSTVSGNYMKLQLDGASEPYESHPSLTDELKTFRLLQHQNPVSLSNFSSVSYPSVLLSHPAEVSSPEHPFSQGSFNSALSLRPNIFTQPDAVSASFTASFPPFHQSVFVDFSYCPVECIPHVPTDV